MAQEQIPILTKDKLLLFFNEEAVEHQVQGMMLFDKVLFMKIFVPGTKDEMIHEVEREYPEGYPSPIYGKVKKNMLVWDKYKEYIEQYKKGHEGGPSTGGTPIETWPQVDVRRAAQLKHLGVYAVEQLAVMHDEAIGRLGMGGRDLVKKAQLWLQQRQDDSLVQKMAAEKQQMQGQIDALKEQMEDLAEALNSLPQEARAEVQQTIVKRRGRPPKVQAVA